MRTLTAKERIHLHLFDYSRFSDAYEAPPEVTQEAIARAAGIRVQHVVQYVRPLMADGLVEERLAHVKRSRGRHKAYSLTPKRRSPATALRSHLLPAATPIPD